MKNKLIIAGFALIFVLAFMFFYITMDIEVNRYLEGGIFSNDMGVSEEVEIVIGGDKVNKILDGSLVYGTFRIMGGTYYNFEMTFDNGLYQGTLYRKDDNGNGAYIPAGEIAASEDIYQVWANIYEYDEKYGADTFVAAPAISIEEGNNIRKIIFGE